MLADDLGYGDVGVFNARGRIPTPHLDRLAREGLRFTDAHTPSAVCTPTRYGLLTGRYPWRTRLARGVLWGNGDSLIEPGRATLATLLQRRGYQTAEVGKWHLGLRWAVKAGATADRTTNNENAPVDWIDYAQPIVDGPTHHGFDEYFGLPASLDMRDYVYIDGTRIGEVLHALEEAVPRGRLGGFSAPRPGSPEERGLPPVQLYDLETDPGETTNLHAQHPDVVKRLTTRLEAYRAAGRSR